MERWKGGGGVVHDPVHKHLWIVQCVYKYIHTYTLVRIRDVSTTNINVIYVSAIYVPFRI